MLFSFIQIGVLAQSLPPTDNWFQYGLAGALVVLMIMLLKYIMQRDKQDIKERRETEKNLALQRSEMYREDNKLRDERWVEAICEIKEVLERVDSNYKEASENFINANKENIDRFIAVVNKVMENNSYTAQVLTGLKSNIERLESSNKTEFEKLKNKILEHLQNLTLHYEIKRKEE